MWGYLLMRQESNTKAIQWNAQQNTSYPMPITLWLNESTLKQCIQNFKWHKWVSSGQQRITYASVEEQ